MPGLNKVIFSIASAVPRAAMMSLWTCPKRAERVGSHGLHDESLDLSETRRMSGISLHGREVQ